ncbi:MAG TPA: AI-2E family transporter [Acidimicrobiales bacterium]|nr:AI-2E family transporter [Acidimicrobiales bacterium]
MAENVSSPAAGGASLEGEAGEGHLTHRVLAAADARRVPLATIVTTVGVIVATGIVLLLLWTLRIDVLYVVVASFVAVILSGPVNFLQRRGLSRGLAATIIFVGGVVALGVLIFLLGSPLVSAVNRFVHQLPHLVNQAEHGKGAIGRLLRRFHLLRFVQQNLPKLSTAVTHLSKPALSFGKAALSTVIAVFVIAFLSFFIVLEAPNLAQGFYGMLRPDRAARVQRVWHQVTLEVSGYVLGDVTTSVIAGVVVLITLLVLGVPFAFLLGFWVAFVDLLPMVGGLLAGVPTVIIAFIHSLPAGIITLVVFLVYQQIENHVLNPLIMSKTVHLSPLWVLLAALIGANLGDRIGSTFGAFIGTLIGIPVGGALQVIFREIRRGVPAEEGEGVGETAVP